MSTRDLSDINVCPVMYVILSYIWLYGVSHDCTVVPLNGVVVIIVRVSTLHLVTKMAESIARLNLIVNKGDDIEEYFEQVELLYSLWCTKNFIRKKLPTF